jgi:hypothetical protein
MDDELEVKIDPLDYIMSRIWDSGKLQNKPFEAPFIYFDDLKEVLSQILCFDNMEEN